MDILIPSIKEMLADPGKAQLGITLIQTMQAHLFEGKVGASKDFVEKPIAELIKTQAWANVSRSASDYLKTSISGLVGNWAVKYNSQSGVKPLNLGAAGIIHAVNTISTEVKEPNLSGKLAAWQAMPEATREEKKAKEDKKAELLKLFAPASAKLLNEGGWDNDKNILAPQSFKKIYKDLIKDTLLPDMLFRISCDMLVAKPLAAETQAKLDKMTGVDRLKQIGTAINKLAQPHIHSALSEYNDLIAEEINALAVVDDKNPQTAKSRMTAREEVVLAADLEDIGQNDGPGMQKAMTFVDGLAERLIQSGLQSIAAKGEATHDATTNVLLHLRKRLAEQKLDKKLVQKLENYLDITKDLSVAEEKLSQLRKQGVEKYRQIQAETVMDKKGILEKEFEEILNEIESQQFVCRSKEQEINQSLADKYQKLNAAKFAKKLEKEKQQHEKLAALQAKFEQLQAAAVLKFQESQQCGGSR